MERISTKKIKIYTKETLKILNIALISFGIIIAIILIKYKPMYEVRVSGRQIGYTENKDLLIDKIKKYITDFSSDNIEKIELKENPDYELKLVTKLQESNDSEIIIALQNEANIIFKEKNEDSDKLEIASNSMQSNTLENSISLINSDSKINSSENNVVNTEKNDLAEIANVNGIKFLNVPITGTITSRYGESSSLRKSKHTGLDIAASTGTKIKVVADGTVVFASYNGSYGNLVKIDHGNGVQTWYAHTSKMLVSVGKQVKAGDVIALVGSTGNSTGPHLHFEIRINNEIVNPQKYIYK